MVQKSEDTFTVIDGVRRLEALKELHIQELIVGREVVIEAEETKADSKFKQIIANIQRENINDIELGHAFVSLKGEFGYDYKETAEIIGKTPHYVTAKVGLATRLISELQEQVVQDWSEAKCIQDTFSDQDAEKNPPYEMNIKIIEDIARLPPELQRAAFDAIKAKEMDTEEALRFLRSVKRDSDVLRLADEVKGLMESYSQEAETSAEELSQKELHGYLRKINDDIDEFANKIKVGDIGQQEQVARELESLMAKLNTIYDAIIKEISTGGLAAGNASISGDTW